MSFIVSIERLAKSRWRVRLPEGVVDVSTAQILRYSSFKKAAAASLGVTLPRLTDLEWCVVLNTALAPLREVARQCDERPEKEKSADEDRYE